MLGSANGKTAKCLNAEVFSKVQRLVPHRTRLRGNMPRSALGDQIKESNLDQQRLSYLNPSVTLFADRENVTNGPSR